MFNSVTMFKLDVLVVCICVNKNQKKNKNKLFKRNKFLENFKIENRLEYI